MDEGAYDIEAAAEALEPIDDDEADDWSRRDKSPRELTSLD